MARFYRRRLAQIALASALVLPGSMPAAAQPQGRAEQIPPIDDRTKDLKKIDGFFPLYWNEASGRLWMEIPRMDVEVLYSTGLASGLGSNDIGLDRGMLIGSRIVKFERAGSRIMMVQPNYRFRALTTNAAEARTVRDAFARSILWSFPVAAASGGRVLVDATDFIVRDSTEIAGRLTPGSYRFEPTRSSVYMAGVAAFPKNTELEAELTFARQPGAADAAAAGAAAARSKASAASRPTPRPQACASTTRSPSCRMPATSRAGSIHARGSARRRSRITRRCLASRCGTGC